MEKSDYIWMNGVFVPWDDAKIHVLSHSLHYGGAVFEGVRFYECEDGKTAVFRIKEHMERLLASSKSLEMDVPYSADDLCKAALETIKKNNLKSGYVRPIIYFGYGKMGLTPTGSPLEVTIAVWKWGSYLGEESIKVKTSSYMRIHPKSTDIDSKITGHYVNSMLSSLEAHRKGYHEALLLDYEGYVAEGPGENIFAVKNGELFTPAPGNIIEGITRDSIFTIAKDLNIKVTVKKMTPEELKQADEAFLTGTAAEVTPIHQIDDTIIGDGSVGPVSKKLKTVFTDAIHGKIDSYKTWLTYV